jgi:hypothetical protein
MGAVKAWVLIGSDRRGRSLTNALVLSSGGSHRWRVSKSRTVLLGWKVVS